MSTQDPSGQGPEQQGDGPPSFDKPPPQSGGPYGDSPYGAAPPPPFDPTGAYGTGRPPIPGMPPLGGLGRRLLARIIDGVMISALCALVLGWFIDWESRSGEVTLSLTFGIVYWVYESLMLAHDGRTVGKRVTKVRVARLVDGGVPTTGAAWGRAAVYTLPAVLCCGLWTIVNGGWCVFDRPYRQCLHDKAVHTVVVSTE